MKEMILIRFKMQYEDDFEPIAVAATPGKAALYADKLIEENPTLYKNGTFDYSRLPVIGE